MNLISMYLRKYRYAIFLNIGLVFCFVFNGYGTTWYISPVGSDVTGDGTINNPWQTLYKATETVISFGDTIHVKQGIYIETSHCNLSTGVSIYGDDKTTTIIKGTLTTSFTALIEMHSDDGTNGNQSISNITFDGQYVDSTNQIGRAHV